MMSASQGTSLDLPTLPPQTKTTTRPTVVVSDSVYQGMGVRRKEKAKLPKHQTQIPTWLQENQLQDKRGVPQDQSTNQEGGGQDQNQNHTTGGEGFPQEG